MKILRVAMALAIALILGWTVPAFAGDWQIGADGGFTASTGPADNQSFAAPQQLNSTDGFIAGGHAYYDVLSWLGVGSELYYYQEGMNANGMSKSLATHGALAFIPLALRAQGHFGNWMPYFGMGVGFNNNYVWINNSNFPGASSTSPISLALKVDVGTDYYITKTTALNAELGLITNNATQTVNFNGTPVANTFANMSVFYGMIGFDFNL